MRYGRHVTGELFGGTKCSKEAGARSVEDFDNTSGNSTRILPNWVMMAGVNSNRMRFVAMISDSVPF